MLEWVRVLGLSAAKLRAVSGQTDERFGHWAAFSVMQPGSWSIEFADRPILATTSDKIVSVQVTDPFMILPALIES